MKKLFGITVMMIGFAVASQAQQAATPQSQPQPQTQHAERKQAMQELNLTKEQRQQMKAANESFKDKMKAIRSDSSLSKEQRRTQLQNLNKERMDKINTILTPEQQQKMAQMKVQARKNRRHDPTNTK